MKKFLKILVILLIIAGIGFFTLRQFIEYQYTKPIVLNERIIIVNQGDSINSIASDLFTNKKQQFLFKKIALLKKKDKAIKTGEFLIPAESSIKDLLDIITSNDTINYKVTIIEGYQKYQIPTIFNGIKNLLGEIPPITQEGVFMPDTYYYKTGDTKLSILQRANKSMEDYLTKAWEERDKNIPIKTKREALILSSIVEKETGREDEYKLVSSVFMNRLNKGMKLQADPTSIYGITKGESKFNRKLFKGDLQKKNEFNTYYINGLPKEPICNPGKNAIDAVMHPADTQYLYFVADGTGGHVFAETGKEHEKNVIQWRKIKKEEQL